MRDRTLRSAVNDPAQPAEFYPPAVAPEIGWAGDAVEPEINIADYLRLVWSKRWLIAGIVCLVMALVVVWTMTQEEIFRADTTITVDARVPQIIKQQLILGPSFWEQERYLLEQEGILTSYDLSTRVAERLGLDDGAAEVSAEKLQAMLSVKSSPESGGLTLSMTGINPVQISEWLNIYVDEFIRYNIDDTLHRTQQVYEVIQSRLRPLYDQVKESEGRLTTYKERQDSLLAGDQDKNVISEQVNTLTTEFAQAKSQRIRHETKLRALEELRRSQVTVTSAPELLSDPSIQALRQQLHGQGVALQKALQTYRDEHPVIRAIRGEIEGIEARIQEQVDTIIAVLRADFENDKRREEVLYLNLQQLRDETIELSRQTMEYETLKRDYEQNKSFYEDMLSRSKEAEITGTVSFNRVRVIDRARAPGRPISPNVPRAILTSLMLGLFMGVGLVLTMDFLDRSLRTPDDVERHLGLEALAVVPVNKEVKDRALLEVYQGLRTAVMFAARDDRCQLVVVTSAGPSEGKTTTTLNLGKVLAVDGKRVLIMEGDLRKPALYRQLSDRHRKGLTTLVLGETNLEESVHQLEGYPDLDILTSGPLPPNPPELFGKVAFQQLLETAHERYQWILLDTPPVVSVTDAVVCASFADMVLLVVEYGRLDRKVIQGARRQLLRAGGRLIGAVLNRVNLERSHYYYDAHYYSYYYGFDEDGETRGAWADVKDKAEG